MSQWLRTNAKVSLYGALALVITWAAIVLHSRFKKPSFQSRSPNLEKPQPVPKFVMEKPGGKSSGSPKC